MINRFVVVVSLILFACLMGHAQKPDLTKWTTSTTDSSVVFNVEIEKGWLLYSSDFDPNLGPLITTFEFDSSLFCIGSISAINSKRKFDELWGGEYTYFKNRATFIQLFDSTKISKGVEYSSTANFQVCNDENGRCILYTNELGFKFE